jgi:hypothetical protein
MSVGNALRENSIKYTLIYPEKDSKDFWLQRFQKRGDSPQFINKLLMNWDTFIDEMEQETFPEKFILRFDDVIDVALMNHIMSYDEK